MKESNHTPGPWDVRPLLMPEADEDPLAVYVIENVKWDMDRRFNNAPGEPGSNDELDYLAMIHAENRANSHLIELAPDMYETLRGLVNCHTGAKWQTDEVRREWWIKAKELLDNLDVAA